MRCILLLCCLGGCGLGGRANVGPTITTDGRAGAEVGGELAFHVLPAIPVTLRTEVAVLGDETQVLVGAGFGGDAPPVEGRGGHLLVTRMGRLDDEGGRTWRFDFGMTRVVGTPTKEDGCHNERQECMGLQLHDVGASAVGVSVAANTSRRFTVSLTIERSQVTGL